MGAEKLAEGRGYQWILNSFRDEVETGSFRVAGEEELVRPSRRADLEHNGTIRGLMNFLNPALG